MNILKTKVSRIINAVLIGIALICFVFTTVRSCNTMKIKKEEEYYKANYASDNISVTVTDKTEESRGIVTFYIDVINKGSVGLQKFNCEITVSDKNGKSLSLVTATVDTCTKPYVGIANGEKYSTKIKVNYSTSSEVYMAEYSDLSFKTFILSARFDKEVNYYNER